MMMNLLIAEINFRTKKNLQLVGLADKYLGKFGGACMGILVYATLFGAMLAYLVGTGDAIAALFGVSAGIGSMAVFTFSAIIIYLGLGVFKNFQFIFTIAAGLIIILFGFLSAPHAQFSHIVYTDMSQIFFPYGVILFAFHTATTVSESYSLLPRKITDFRRVIMYSSGAIIALYALFCLCVVSVTGNNTTQVGTIGLAHAVGPSIFFLSNIMALIIMMNNFILSGIVIRDSCMWDLRIPKIFAWLIAISIPLILFVAGLRDFITILDVVGGVLISIELILLLIIYMRAHSAGDYLGTRYDTPYGRYFAAILLIIFVIGAIQTIMSQL